MKHLLTVLLSLSLTGLALAQSDPFAPAEKLAEGWDQIDQRLIFLTIRLANTEASIDAVEKALVSAKSKAGIRASVSRRADLKNEEMDRKGGGPMKWSEFYGRTAEKFFYHPTDRNSTYHTVTVLNPQPPQSDNQSSPGVASRQGLPVHQRPPQFDYIYRANETAKARAEQDIEALKSSVDDLELRRHKLEAEQAGLWVEIAFRAVSHYDLDKKPLYRFEPLLVDSTTEARQQAEIVKTASSFMRVSLSIVEQAQKDQATTFSKIKTAVSVARLKLNDDLLRQGIDVSDRSTATWKFAAVAKRLDDMAANLSESYVVAIEGDQAKDEVRKETFRGLLQQSLVSYAQAVLALDEMSMAMQTEWKIKPDLNKPISLVSTTASPASSPKLEQRTGSLADLLPMNEQKNETASASDELRPKAKSKSVRWTPKVNNEKSIKEFFTLQGNWRIELGGVRLFTGASIETTEMLVGDFTMTTTANVRIDTPMHYWIQIQACGESFAVKSTGNANLRLERKADKLGFQFGNQQPTVIIIKDANIDKPTAIRMFCVPNGNYSGLSEMFVQSIGIVGKVSNNELIP